MVFYADVILNCMTLSPSAALALERPVGLLRVFWCDEAMDMMLTCSLGSSHLFFVIDCVCQLGTCAPWCIRIIRDLTDRFVSTNSIILWMHKQDILAQKEWYFSRGGGNNEGCTYWIDVLKSRQVHILTGTAAKEKKGWTSNWSKLERFFWL